ncbi:PAS domain-containing protein [uncultured Oxalicibacterium sp.]|uniref:PAS domain-containing sensor histidine kinase n=1 Tax=uncultured Oxalicibacterium sp. TaxID=1168540 RepID=UPI0025D4CE53|nr:PAS domain-containing protein [uncultured Oxalicibacterium sp.]
MGNDDNLQKAILDNIPDQAWLKDRESRYIHVNDAFMAACGLSEEQIVGKTPDQVWPRDWGEKYIGSDRHVMESGQRMRYEEQRQGADGKLRWYDTIKTPVRNAHGETIGTTGISRDITDRKQAEQALLESRSQLRELSAYLQSIREEERTRIARELHDELGQSLTAIRLGLDVAASQSDMQSATMQRHLEKLQELAASTIESVQRIAADLRPPILDELGLPVAIEWLVDTFAERTGIVCELHLPPALSVCEREISTAIFRILQEALTNVSRHSRATHVVITVAAGAGELQVHIADNGCGIAAGISRDNSLGLMGMRERALMLGGQLQIHSAPGEGTRIDVILPYALDFRGVPDASIRPDTESTS